MKRFINYIAIFSLFWSCAQNTPIEQEVVHLTNLRCELMPNPVGIDNREPALSWKIHSQQKNIRQTAYHILVASSKEKLDENTGDIWDSEKEASSKSIFVKFDGVKLKSNTRYFWKVKIWTENGESEWSETAFWHQGFQYYKDWRGRWIGLDRAFPWDNESTFSRLSARYLRKEIETQPKKIKQATAYIIGLGQYELYLNGEKVGNHVMAPSPTDFTKNVKYNTFDVTSMLRNGENAIGVILGNGLYYTMRQHYKPYKIKNFGYPKMIFNLIVEYEDGSNSKFQTDNSWKITSDGPIRSNNIYDGEEYDARKEMPGWNKIGYNDGNWLQAEYVQQPRGEYEAQLNENMKVMHEVKPVKIISKSPDRFILDVGQNMAGWLRITVNGKRGDKVIMRFAESLDENNELVTAPLRDAKVTDVYTLKGGETETWEPRFVYHGFRFVEIKGYPGNPELENFTACAVYDEMDKTGTFETSNPIINQVFKNAFWTINSNYKGIPIDCPQRNERMPWLGDRAIGCYSESFILDNSKLYLKWLDDIMYSQKADGSLSDVAPPYFRYYSDNMTWPGTYILVAEMLYRQFGMTEHLNKHYPHMKKWLEYMRERYKKEGIMTKDSYGDWCAPPKTVEEGRGKNANVKFPSDVIATAYYHHLLEIMGDFANILDKNNDKVAFDDLADKVKTDFHKNFYDSIRASYGNHTLTDNILPVYFDMVPKDLKAKVLNTIKEIIMVENNGHLSSGLVGVQWLMRTLSENSMQDIAYQLATTTTYPSWGYMVENGATTIWELWNANTAAPNMNSQNHVMMLGDLIIWYYENLAGIKSSIEDPGFKKIEMQPEFNIGLDYVKASYQSPYGEIKSHWVKENNKILWKVTIPANTSAEIYFPTAQNAAIKVDGKNITDIYGITLEKTNIQHTIYNVGSGNYKFEIKLN